MIITDGEFLLVRQRNRIAADAEAAIDGRDREIWALRAALATVKRELVQTRAEKLSLEIQLQRARPH